MDALARQVEERVRSRNYDPDELERINNLSFTPVSPSDPRGFDPALTSELFERPVAIPDFTSRKFRYLRGPLKRLARRIFKLLAQVNDKLAENKIQAFYNLVHELIAMNYRHNKLQNRFDLVLRENLRLRERLERALESVSSASEAPSFEGGTMVIPEPHPVLRTLDQALLDRLYGDEGENLTGESGITGDTRESALCLNDEWGYLAFEVKSRGFQDVRINLNDALQCAYVKKVRGLTAEYTRPDSLLVSRPADGADLILMTDLENVSRGAESLPELWVSRLREGGHLVLRVNRGLAESAFGRHSAYRVEQARLVETLTSLGLSLIYEGTPPELQEGSFELILRKNGDAS